MYCICQQVYCICHHLTSGATLGCTTLAIKCTAEDMMYFRSFTSVTWVYCISYHVHQEPHLGVLHLPTGTLHLPSSVLQRPSCTSGTLLQSSRSLSWVYCICQQVAEGMMYFRSPNSATWVYCICHQVYCISYHVNQEPQLVYCICQQVYCICHHQTPGATLGCTTLAIKCTAEAMMYFRASLQSLGCTAFAIKCTAYPIM